MQKLVKEYLSEWKKQQKKRRRISIAVMLLIVMVVSCVIGSLTQYGVALTGDPKCGMEEHQHNDSCYTSVLTCKQEESEGHQHNDSCYTTTTELTCGQEEGEEHQHDDSCYTETSELTCGQEESDGHTHTDECYTEEFTCDMEEHTHTDECYIDTDAEDAAVWEASFSEIELTDNWAENVAAIAETQVGYQASNDNYELAENGVIQRRYTRYGQWYQSPYGDEEGHWDTIFAAFCLDYAGVKNVPYGKNVREWTEQLSKIDKENINNEKSKLFFGRDYEASVGDIVFLDDDNDGELNRCGILVGIEPQVEGNTANYQIIEVKDDQLVVRQEYEIDDDRIASWIQVPKNPETIIKTENIKENQNKDLEYKQDTNDVLQNEELKTENMIQEQEIQEQEAQEQELQEQELRKQNIIASIPVINSDGTIGSINLELLYGDTKDYEAHPNGTSYYTNQTMTGYVRLYANDVSGDTSLNDMSMTLYFPKEYLQKDKITVSKVNQNLGEFTIKDVEEDGEYYKVKIDISGFSQTANLRFPFKMQFKPGEVPKNYKLKIYAELESDDDKDETAEYTYLPKYDAPYITKYANTNTYASMANDGTYITAKINDKGELYNDSYSSFWFTLGGDIQKSFRTYGKVILTDTLPTYEDIEGEMRTAVLDQSNDEGWQNNGDGTVSYIIELPENFVDDPAQVDVWLAEKIEKVELRLCFPKCKLEEKNPESLIWEKELTNRVKAECIPWHRLEGEESDICEDDIKFILTNQPSGDGSFAKYNSQNVIVDRENMRSALYQWGMRFENTNSTTPLEDIVFSDEKLDSRLKFREIEMTTEDWESKVDYVEVEWENKEIENSKYHTNDFEGNKLLLPNDKICIGFKVHLKKDYKMKLNESFEIVMRSTFREPGKNHFDKEVSENNRYINSANVSFHHEGSNKWITLTSWNEFKLTEIYEGVWVEKTQHYGPSNSVFQAGDSVDWRIQIHGIRETGEGLAEDKDYKDLKVVDLLPDGFDFTLKKFWAADNSYDCIEGATIVGNNGNVERNPNYKPEIIENYKGTGRTALIFKINADKAKDVVNNTFWKNVDIYISLETATTIFPGNYKNDVYLVSKDLTDDPTHGKKIKDQYDMDEDGNTEDYISCWSHSITIKTDDAIYCQKYIAEKDSENWKTSALLLSEGEDFQYKLKVRPVAGSDKNLVIYDVLPQRGDKNILGNDRKSEFNVQLRDFIEPPDGYTIFYTLSPLVYSNSMDQILKNDGIEWKEKSQLSKNDLENITAFKVVAGSGVTLVPNQDVDVIVPVKIIDEIENKDSLLLELEESGTNGIAQFLESVNSFGYCTDNTKTADSKGTGIKESNYVRVKIPFLNFSIRKIGSDTKNALSGAEFMLEKDGEIITEKISETDGRIIFRELEAGTYTLTETSPPRGYTLPRVNTWTINITCDLDRNEYKAELVGSKNIGNGTKTDPFVIENIPTYELPSTGGIGIYWYMFGGMLLMLAAALMAYRKKCKGVLES